MYVMRVSFNVGAERRKVERSTGIGVRHNQTGLILYRDPEGYYLRVEHPTQKRDLRHEESTWSKISNGLFWTIFDFIKRKDCFQGELQND